MQNLTLGIDIGGTNTSYGLVNRRGQIIEQGKIKTTGSTIAAYTETLKKAVLPLIERTGRQGIAGVGVGAPNANYYTGEIANAANLPWKGVIPLAKILTEALGLKATVTNDANAAAIGEMTYGAAKSMKDFIMVTLGTGVGSGFVANGQLIYGHDGFAGELGHVTAIRDGRACGCGRKGCLETYASATGIVRTAKEWLAERQDKSRLRQYNNLTARHIHTSAESGDALALDLFEYTGKILGLTLADVVAITSPQAIVFFGGLAQSGKLILEPAQQHMEENLLPVFRNKIAFLQSALPAADAAILGASALAWQS
jgi:glucokinase